MSKSRLEFTPLQSKSDLILQKTLLFKLWEAAHFSTGVATLEIKLEVGGFRPAAKSHYKTFQTNFQALSGQWKSARTYLKISQDQHVEIELYRNLHKFIGRIEAEVLYPLRKAKKSKSESGAQKFLKLAFKACKKPVVPQRVVGEAIAGAADFAIPTKRPRDHRLREQEAEISNTRYMYVLTCLHFCLMAAAASRPRGNLRSQPSKR